MNASARSRRVVEAEGLRVARRQGGRGCRPARSSWSAARCRPPRASRCCRPSPACCRPWGTRKTPPSGPGTRRGSPGRTRSCRIRARRRAARDRRARPRRSTPGDARVDVEEVRRLAGAELGGHRGGIVAGHRLVVDLDLRIGRREVGEHGLECGALLLGCLPAGEHDRARDRHRVEPGRCRRRRAGLWRGRGRLRWRLRGSGSRPRSCMR